MNNVDEEDEDGHKEERVNSVYTKKILKYCFLEDNLHLTILDKADLEIFANEFIINPESRLLCENDELVEKVEIQKSQKTKKRHS